MDQAYKEKMVKALFPDRKKDGNKSDFGRSLLIGGSRKYPGCVKITSDFAYLSGNGYTAIAVPDSILTVTEMRANPTEIFEMIPNTEDSFLWEDSLVLELNKYDTILFGNGIRECPENLSFLLHLLENYKGTLIVDASGIDLFALADKKVLKHKRTKHLLFTPHLKEASRLLARDTLDFNVLAHAAFDFASEYDVTLLLKSSHSALIAHDGIRYSSYPDPDPFPRRKRGCSGWFFGRAISLWGETVPLP